MLWCTRFFIMVVHVCTKSISKQGIQKKNCLQELPILLVLNYYTFMCTCDFYRYGHIILRKEGISKQDTCEDDFNLIRILAACISG